MNCDSDAATPDLVEGMYIQPIQVFFIDFQYQGGMESTVSGVFEDLKFKVSECYDQFWSKSSEILNLRSSTTPETVAFTLGMSTGSKNPGTNKSRDFEA